MRNAFGLYIDNLYIDEVEIDSEGDDNLQIGAAEYFFRIRMGHNKIMEEKGFEIRPIVNTISPMPRIKERRPYDYEKFADGYMESDRDFVENNFEAVVWFLENHEKIKKVLDKL